MELNIDFFKTPFGFVRLATFLVTLLVVLLSNIWSGCHFYMGGLPVGHGCSSAFEWPLDHHALTGLGFTAGSSIVLLLVFAGLILAVVLGKREKIPKIVEVVVIGLSLLLSAIATIYMVITTDSGFGHKTVVINKYGQAVAISVFCAVQTALLIVDAVFTFKMYKRTH